MIERAEWDSNFFGFPVGILKFQVGMDWSDIKQVLAETKRFKLIYIFSDEELEDSFKTDLVDTKVTFKKTLEAGSTPEEIIEFDPKIHSYDQLLDLVYLSGSFSRFKKDKNFSTNAFFKLYQKWIDNSISKENALKILIKRKGKDISGFITLGRRDSTSSQIGLVAVNKSDQGRSIGSKLIKECEYLSYLEGFSEIEVATQWENSAAQKLYKKNNFNIKNIRYIYHLWNQNFSK